MLPRYSYLILIAIVAVAATVSGFVYVVPVLFPQKPSAPMSVIHIPKGSSIAPPNWRNFTDLSSPTFHYPFNFTVVIGTNNTIQWVNDDGIAHTVTSLQVPSLASTFNSGLINPGKTFTATLTVVGVYKYTCAWHNWLAGVITVKQG